MIRCFLASVILILTSPPAMAQDWAVERSASRLAFQSSFNGVAFQGVFRRWDAKIRFDPRNLSAARVVVLIDVATAVTGNPMRDEALPSIDWFAAARFPQARFETRRFTALGKDRYEAIGDLTLRGVRRPAVLPFTLRITGGQARMEGRLVIERNLFGVGKGQWSGDKVIPNTVVVNVRLEARRARSAT
jgi:polyisoprenoid-binding protein YceI